LSRPRGAGATAALDVQKLAPAGGRVTGAGHQVSHTLVGELLESLDYSLQGNRKTKEGLSHPDRDAQFCYINDKVAEALAEQQPVISVDTKKKELVGDFKNAGREYRPKGTQKRFRSMTLSSRNSVGPYGVYDIAANFRLGERRHRPRHRRLRGEQHQALVVRPRPRTLSRGHPPRGDRRWRRQQRLAGAPVEA
jgi:hypothetical protein